MNKYGILGRKLAHSFSPTIHKALGNPDYGLFEVEPEDLESFLKNPELRGLNITIPYKEKVMAYCDELSPRAENIGAVNTMVRQDDGSWYGTNTDYDGFQLTVRAMGLELQEKRVVILGNGATAKTVASVLEDMGAHITQLARRKDLPFKELQNFEDTRLIINTTPVGMYPDCPNRLISLEGLEALEGVIDVIYNPRRTGLILDAEDRGIPAIDGLPMLLGQAIAAANLFQGERLWDKFPELLASLRLKNENIVLLGMPGAGKSSVGRALAKLSGRPFVDTDDLFDERYSSPEDYIKSHGQDAFREKEAEIVREVGKLHGHIIATGGGVVIREENRDPLWQNGSCYYIARPIDDLPTVGRPLSQGGPWRRNRLMRERFPAYQAFSHVSVRNEDIEATAEEIWEDFNARAHS